MRIYLEFIWKLTINMFQPEFEKINLPRSLLIRGSSRDVLPFPFYYSTDCFIHRVTPRMYNILSHPIFSFYQISSVGS